MIASLVCLFELFIYEIIILYTWLVIIIIIIIITSLRTTNQV